MLTSRRIWLLIAATIALTTFATAENAGLNVHDDYYRGFAHGAYYGLMLEGADYNVAWCMKVELEYEASDMGTGEDFQRKMEAMLDTCRQENSDD